MKRLDTTNDRGQVTAFVVVVLAALALLCALVYDGGAAMAQRSRALTLAQEAARAGAQELDLDAYRAGAPATLHPDAAESTARDFLTAAGITGSAQVHGDTVTVTAKVDYTFRTLPLGTRTLSAYASARPQIAPTP